MSGRVLLADGRWQPDVTRIVRDAAPESVVPGDVIGLASWLALAGERRAGVGVWLAPDDEPNTLADQLSTLALVAIDFPAMKDGRGYSIASLVRTRHGFRGDLRAIGDVQVDQLFYLRRVGFSSFALRADQDPERAARALQTFSDVYQASADQPLPHFRRRRHLAGATR